MKETKIKGYNGNLKFYTTKDNTLGIIKSSSIDAYKKAWKYIKRIQNEID